MRLIGAPGAAYRGPMSKLFDLAGKVAIVTGGNGGIGRAIAVGLAQHGADLVVAARNERKTAAVVDEIRELGRRAVGVRCDVLERADIDRTVDTAVRELGGVNILVNNSGVGHGGQPTQAVALETWDRVVATNLTSVFQFCQAVHPALVQAGGGKIINVGSGYSLVSAAGNAPYAASKAGVWNLTRTMALDWAGDNIQVNLIAPGWIRTEMTDPVWEDRERTAYIIDETPAGRLGEPEDMAGAAIFLASPASDFVTGTFINADGGMKAGDKAWPRPQPGG